MADLNTLVPSVPESEEEDDKVEDELVMTLWDMWNKNEMVSSGNKIKSVVVGDGAVGKTCLIVQYSDGPEVSDLLKRLFHRDLQPRNLHIPRSLSDPYTGSIPSVLELIQTPNGLRGLELNRLQADPDDVPVQPGITPRLAGVIGVALFVLGFGSSARSAALEMESDLFRSVRSVYTPRRFDMVEVQIRDPIVKPPSRRGFKAENRQRKRDQKRQNREMYRRMNKR